MQKSRPTTSNIVKQQLGYQVKRLMRQGESDAVAHYVAYSELNQQRRADIESLLALLSGELKNMGPIGGMELLYKMGRLFEAKEIREIDVRNHYKRLRRNRLEKRSRENSNQA